MRKIISAIFLATFIVGCNNGQSLQTVTDLPATAFSDQLNKTPQATIIDVRTAGEFETGHLVNALNYDWNGREFDNQIATLDKSKPVFVYCLSGGRSESAANKMRAAGFKMVYTLNGGMLKWRNAGLPETTASVEVSAGLSMEAFNALISSDRLVLVDFYAEWCAPCKKMKPFLDEISTDMAKTVSVVRIDADANPALCKELGIEGLPTLKVYKNKKITWSHTGYVDKPAVLKQLH